MVRGLLVLVAPFFFSSVHLVSNAPSAWAPDAEPARLEELFGAEGLWVLERPTQVVVLEIELDDDLERWPEIAGDSYGIVRSIRVDSAETRRVVGVLSQEVGPPDPARYRSAFSPERAVRFVRGRYVVELLDDLGGNQVAIYVIHDPNRLGWVEGEVAHLYEGSLGPEHGRAMRAFSEIYRRAGMPRFER